LATIHAIISAAASFRRRPSKRSANASASPGPIDAQLSQRYHSHAVQAEFAIGIHNRRRFWRRT
jgi:hypothetical protein